MNDVPCSHWPDQNVAVLADTYTRNETIKRTARHRHSNTLPHYRFCRVRRRNALNPARFPNGADE